MFKTFDQVLTILDFSMLENIDFIPVSVLQLLDERNDAKNSKDFELSDRLRSKIVKL
jgi:cysteinyl-tRNA synthetase